MIIVVTGSRNWKDYDTLRSYIDLLSKKERILHSPHFIVHGDAKGADQLANKYAIQHSIPIKAFPADWTLGNKAGPIRNQQMIDWAIKRALQFESEVICIAFPLPKSKGTWDCIRRCVKEGVKTYVIGADS